MFKRYNEFEYLQDIGISDSWKAYASQRYNSLK